MAYPHIRGPPEGELRLSKPRQPGSAGGGRNALQTVRAGSLAARQPRRRELPAVPPGAPDHGDALVVEATLKSPKGLISLLGKVLKADGNTTHEILRGKGDILAYNAFQLALLAHLGAKIDQP